jgi:hypothetical protein
MLVRWRAGIGLRERRRDEKREYESEDAGAESVHCDLPV